MNSRFAVILLALAAVSCTSQIVLEPKDSSVKVVMNALLKTEDVNHVILLSASNVSSVEALPDASVTVSVNGGAPVNAVYQPENPEGGYYIKPKAAYYLYHGSFSPGDNVRLEARTKYGNVSSTVTVPSKVNMDQVDTLRTVIRGSGYTEVNMQFKIRLSDNAAGSDFYRFTFRRSELYDWNDSGVQSTMLQELPADGSSDPVLSEGTLNTGDLLSELLELDNTYLLFNDNTFPGETRTLRVNVRMENLIASFSFNRDSEVEHGDSFMWVNLEHLSFEEYYYMKALTNLSNFGYDASFFFEPTTIPSNVEGGLGFVGVSASSDPAVFKVPDDIYLYEVRYRQEHPEENPYY
jgi:hypothetical protein